MEHTKQERARRARGHMLDAISRCVHEEELFGWPLAYVLSEYLVRTLQGMYGGDNVGAVEFIREIAERVEGGEWPSQDSPEEQDFIAAVCGMRDLPKEEEGGE